MAILGYLDDRSASAQAFEEHFDLRPSQIDWFNTAARDDPDIELLIAHPEEKHRLANLPDHRAFEINSLGPFRNRKSLGLFD